MSKLAPMDMSDGEDGPRVFVVMPDDELTDAGEIRIDVDPGDEQMKIVPPFGSWRTTGGLETILDGGINE